MWCFYNTPPKWELHQPHQELYTFIDTHCINAFINVLHHTFKRKTLNNMWHCITVLSGIFRESSQTGRTHVFMCLCSASYLQELRQRSGDCLPGHTHGPDENQPVCTRRSALQSVSAAARHSPNHYLQHEARRRDCAWWISSFAPHPSFILCAFPQRLPDSGGQGGCV